MNKANLKLLLRKLGIIKFSDKIRYHWMYIKKSKDNKVFKNEFPNTPIPPDYMMYESFNLSYRNYYNSGKNTAKVFKKLFDNHLDFEDAKILDWGCGPARIVRHFSELCPTTSFFGTDYNTSTIAWNKANIKNVIFSVNDLNPPTSFESGFFDAIYGVSVFTHLSEENHANWINELCRISKKGAILLLTTHGDVFRARLTKNEQEVFDKNQVVVQANTLEGHRTFATYHPPEAMTMLFAGKFQVLEHIHGKIENWGLSQDKWIIKKL